MKCGTNFQGWVAVVAMVSLVVMTGCRNEKQNNVAEKSPAAVSQNSDLGTDGELADGDSSDPDGGFDGDHSRDTRSGGSDSSDLQQGAAEGTSIGSTVYLPIFEKGLQQNVISRRMESNLRVFFQRENKSQMHHFPSAGLRMLKPDAFKLSERFTGFQRPEAGITILTNPFSMQETTKTIIGLVVDSANSGVLFTKDLEIDGYQGTFYAHVESFGDEVRVANYILGIGDDSFSWVVKGSFKTEYEMKDNIGRDVLRAILNVRIADEPRLPPGRDVDFTIQPNILKLNDGFIDKLIFTKGGTFPVNSVTEPIFQAIRVPVEMQVDERQRFARLMITPSPMFKIELLSSEEEIEVDSLQGYEYLAIGQDTTSQEPLQLYSVTLYDNQVAYVMNGWVSSRNTENYVQHFKQLANSFRRLKQSDDNPDDSKPQTDGDAQSATAANDPVDSD